MPFRQNRETAQEIGKCRSRMRIRHRIRARNNKHRSTIPEGFCFCKNCGETIPHKTGVRCRLLRCPKCGKRALRESPWQTQL